MRQHHANCPNRPIVNDMQYEEIRSVGPTVLTRVSVWSEAPKVPLSAAVKALTQQGKILSDPPRRYVPIEEA